MILSKFFRKRALIALFLFLASCTTPCHQWNLQQTQTACPYYNSSRLYYAPEKLSCGLELELDKGYCGFRMYINTFSLPIQTIDNDSNQAIVTITIEDVDYEFQASLLEGAQRVLLPDNACDLVTQTLLEGKLVNISVGRNSETFPPKNFSCLYEKMKSY